MQPAGKMSSGISCCVCGRGLQSSAQFRQVLDPANPSNVKARTFFLTFICPGFQFVEEVSYVCRHPCYRKLERAAGSLTTLQSIVSDLHQLKVSSITLQ